MHGTENELARTYTDYGQFYKQQGSTAQAQEYLTKTLEIVERLGTWIEPDKANKVVFCPHPTSSYVSG